MLLTSDKQIVLSAALTLRDRGPGLLAQTILISPAIDLSFANLAIDAVESRDPWLARPGPRVAAELWRGALQANANVCFERLPASCADEGTASSGNVQASVSVGRWVAGAGTKRRPAERLGR